MLILVCVKSSECVNGDIKKEYNVLHMRDAFNPFFKRCVL